MPSAPATQSSTEAFNVNLKDYPLRKFRRGFFFADCIVLRLLFDAKRTVGSNGARRGGRGDDSSEVFSNMQCGGGAFLNAPPPLNFSIFFRRKVKAVSFICYIMMSPLSINTRGRTTSPCGVQMIGTEPFVLSSGEYTQSLCIEQLASVTFAVLSAKSISTTL